MDRYPSRSTSNVVSLIDYYTVEHPHSAQNSCVAVIYVGGTIGMVKNESGQLVPNAMYLVKTIQDNPIFHHEMIPKYNIIPLEPFMDSSSMNLQDSYRIALKIYQLYDSYTGFVIIQGTDTMAYTASILSFILVNLQKPVVLTGSYIPLSSVYSDGYLNLTGAIMCTTLGIKEVTIYFCHKLMRGNRCQKYSAWDIDAFMSPSLEPLVYQGCTTKVARYLTDSYKPVWPQMYAGKGLHVVNPSSNVEMTIFHPSFSPNYLKAYYSCRGLVIQAYGSGNGPDSYELLDALVELRKGGCAIVIVTQAYTGYVNLGVYAAASILKEAGCLSSFCMTPEAAFCKLSYLIGLGLDRDEVEANFEVCLRGEFYLNGQKYI